MSQSERIQCLDRRSRNQSRDTCPDHVTGHVTSTVADLQSGICLRKSGEVGHVGRLDCGEVGLWGGWTVIFKRTVLLSNSQLGKDDPVAELRGKANKRS